MLDQFMQGKTYLINSKFYFYFVRGCLVLPLCLCTTCMQYLQRPEEDVRAPGNGVALPDQQHLPITVLSNLINFSQLKYKPHKNVFIIPLYFKGHR